MSFIITLYVREGIVMASDSRLTLERVEQQLDQRILHRAVGQSDASYKTFLAPGDIGIATCGAADIQGVPIAGFIESFIAEVLSASNVSVDEVPEKLLEYFRRFDPVPASNFHVAGYKTVDGKREQHIWQVSIVANLATRANDPNDQGAIWGGEIDVLSRIIQRVGLLDDQGLVKYALPNYLIPWGFFTLQDAIDFAIFAIRSTIEAIRFQPRAKTVGGPIDVLIIKPDEAAWIQRKSLRGESG